MSEVIPISKTTLRKLGILLFNLSSWVDKDAKFSRPDAPVRELREVLNDVRYSLWTEINEAEKNDLSGAVSSGETLAAEGNDNRDVSSSTENEKSQLGS